MPANSARILVVDDEPQILRVLRRGLESHGFDVVTAADVASALQIFRSMPVSLIITDLRMPDRDGVDLCREVRRVSPVPVIVLSVKGDERTKVEALDAGADDYVTKPFGMDELLARARALQRRSIQPPGLQERLEVGDFVVEPAQRRVLLRSHELHLTPKEYDLLLFLIGNHSRVLSHRTILTHVWGDNSAEQPEYLRVFVGQLRKKIEQDPRSPRYLLTEPWVGYRFNPER